jgi:DNA-binding NarL/FixJ family response regulator
MPLRVLVVDDHEVVREGVRAILSRRPGVEVVAETGLGRDAIRLAADLRPDVIVLDLGLPDVDGLEVVRLIRRDAGGPDIVVLTVHESPVLLRRAIELGARACVLKFDAGRDLEAAIDATSHGHLFFSGRLASALLDERNGLRAAGADGDRLSRREIEVLTLLAGGRANKEVASVLGISVRTVETHRARIMRKLGAHSIGDLVRHAIRTGLIRP